MSNLQINASQDLAPIASHELAQVAGGDGQPPPARVDGRDVVEAGAAATRATLRPWSLLGNVPEAIHRVSRTDRVGNSWSDRALDGFTGLFGIDPLKPRR